MGNNELRMTVTMSKTKTNKENWTIWTFFKDETYKLRNFKASFKYYR